MELTVDGDWRRGGNSGSQAHVGERLPARFSARESAAKVALVLAEPMEVAAGTARLERRPAE
jgi:hypothetical protein